MLTAFVITIEPHAAPAMLEGTDAIPVHHRIWLNVFDRRCTTPLGSAVALHEGVRQ
jgi:hypothetical protein